MKRFLTLFTMFIVAVAALAFAILNADSVTFRYYLGEFELPLSLLLALTLLFGTLLGALSMLGVTLRQRHENGRLSKRMVLLETELKNLRELPVKDRK